MKIYHLVGRHERGRLGWWSLRLCREHVTCSEARHKCVLSRQASTYSPILSNLHWHVLLLSLIATSSVQAFSQASVPVMKQEMKQELMVKESTKSLSANDFMLRHLCQKSFEYDIYLAGAHVGHFQRVINWKNNNNELSAEVNSTGNIYFLWLESTYKQTSSMFWSPKHNYFITPNFTQKITGLRAREMSVLVSENGLSSTVKLDGEVSQYRSDTSPLYDIDTLGAQIRINLLQDKKAFILYRQATDQIKEYHFKVVGEEVIQHQRWGTLTVIKVREVGEYSKMVLWFSPKLDYQLVKAQLDAFISPMVFLSNFTQQCEL